MSIPFEAIASAALSQSESLVRTWFPAGKRHGREWRIGGIDGSPGESFAINLTNGKWGEFNGLGASGGDLISLYAAKFHGGKNAEAARDLGKQLGIYVNGDASPHVAPVVTAPAENKKTEWKSSVPTDDAPPPYLSEWDHVYEYLDSSKRVIRYVVRKDARGGKDKIILPITWGTLDGKTGWHKKHQDAPRCLYGLDRLADKPTSPVIICEGEKAADAAAKMFPAHVCITWSAGTSNASHTDWTPLIGRDVLIWPDNDEPGFKAAADVRAALAEIAESITTIRVDDLPPKSDAADITPEDPTEWLRARIPEDEPAPLPNHGDWTDSIPETDNTPDDTPQPAEGIVPLGHDRGVFYYLSRSARQVFALQAGQHSRNTLMAMASVAHYWQRTEFVNAKTGAIAWDDAIDWLMVQCRAIGIFDPDRLRGRGAWIDNGRSVLHAGDHLIVDGDPLPLILSGSRYVYEAAQTLIPDLVEPMTTAEAHSLVEICRSLRWERGIYGTLLAGFCAVAPICGGLVWRPSIWITGASGSGKSWAYENVLRAAIGKIALQVQSKTSEAGIRQALGSDARPVLFDEAEREDSVAAARLQGVLDLVRQSASESGGDIIKGTQDQRGAKRFRSRSCFCFVSINVGIEHAADESRITVLSLRAPDPATSETDAEAFQRLQARALDILTPSFAGGLLARSVRLLPVIRANAETFSRAVTLHLGSRRAGDQLGALLAGAYSLHSERAISDADATKYVQEQDWTISADKNSDPDELRLMARLTQHRTRATLGNGGALECTVGRLISAALGRDEKIDEAAAERELREMGIRTDPGGIIVSNTHPALARMLSDTPWSTAWGRTLKRLPGAEAVAKPVRFSDWHIARAVFVPTDAMSGQSGQN